MKKPALKKLLLAALILCPLCVAFAATKCNNKIGPQHQTFVNDQAVLGTWQTVDFVDKIKDFKPGKRSWRGALYLQKMVFKADGAMSVYSQDVPNGDTPWFSWTKGFVLHNGGDQSADKYVIKNGYMFYEWPDGMTCKMSYYVLKKI